MNARESSPDYDYDYESAMEEDATLAVAARTKLPPSRLGTESPQRRRSPSPDPYPTGGGDFGRKTASTIKKEDTDEPKIPLPVVPDEVVLKDNSNNCMDRICK